MNSKFPCIQDFFTPSPSPKRRRLSTIQEVGDGFEQEERELVPDSSDPPDPERWAHAAKYETVCIEALSSGPRKIVVMARIIKIYESLSRSKSSVSASGHWQLLVRDETGVLTIKLWYHDVKYLPHLGQLVTVYAAHVSKTKLKPNATYKNLSTLEVSVSPEKHSTDRIIFHELEHLPTILRFGDGHENDSEPASAVMTLRDFTDGNESRGEVLNNALTRNIGADIRIMACVKKISKPQTFTNHKTQALVTVVNVNIQDQTKTDAMIAIYTSLIPSALTWVPNQTVLLIINPGWLSNSRLSIKGGTTIDVDPGIEHAVTLRRWSQRHSGHVNPEVPAGLFDIEAAETATRRVKFNLGDIDSFIRSRPANIYNGFLSLLLTRPTLVLHYKQKQLFSNECCGIPAYSNHPETRSCAQCDKTFRLRVNPMILGPFVDETGIISAGKAIISPLAWSCLLPSSCHARPLTEPNGEDDEYALIDHALSPSEVWLASATECELALVQSRMSWTRIWVLFGWPGDGIGGETGRLCFLKAGCGLS